MNYFVFTDGTKIPCENVMETSEFHNGQNRRMLTIVLAPDVIKLDALDSILSNEDMLAKTRHLNDAVALSQEAIDKSKVTEPTGSAETIFEGYSIKVSLTKGFVLVGFGGDSDDTLTEKIIIKLAKYTSAEIETASLKTELSRLKATLRSN